ncbi:twin-arginine translocation signal domain-containing protein [Streptomyces sp. NPDC008159]|uniref:twin-arginine translocation signal domain-containing protein n=1 Tax=Streptomyces sp. NPDC008159 TaxID=3364817 RepID=UPI0036E36B3D
MKPMGRRGFLAASTALGIGAGLSTHAILSEVSENETSDKTSDKTSDISRRDQDLPFIGTEETFSTPTLLKLNSINQDHITFLEEIGLSDLGQRRIGDMDAGGLNVQILSAHTPSVQNVPGQRGIDLAYRLRRRFSW